MSKETRDLLERILSVLPGARGLAALWLAIGLWTTICAAAMGRLDSVGALPYWLVVAPLMVLAVLGPSAEPEKIGQSVSPSRLRSIRRMNSSMMRR